jgi:hypothetical protein
MSDLTQAIREGQAQAAGICTEHLRDAIASETAELYALTASLEAAITARDGTPDSECAYAEAFSTVMATLIAIAVMTTELTERPVLTVLPVSLN